MVQKPNESDDEFVTALQKIKRVYQNLLDENLRYTLTPGFLTHIKRHVIESKANTPNRILQVARVADQAAAATSDDDKSMQVALSRIEQRLFLIIMLLDLFARFYTRSINALSEGDSDAILMTLWFLFASKSVSLTLSLQSTVTKSNREAAITISSLRDFSQPISVGRSETGDSGFRQPQLHNSYINSGNFQFLERRPFFANAATGKRCYNCGKVGYVSKICRKVRKVCYTSGMPGHLQRQFRGARPNLS